MNLVRRHHKLLELNAAASALPLIVLGKWKEFGPLRTAGSVKCNETLIKIRLILCQVL